MQNSVKIQIHHLTLATALGSLMESVGQPVSTPCPSSVVSLFHRLSMMSSGTFWPRTQGDIAWTSQARFLFL